MENADKAMDELNGKEFKGRNLRVDEARPPAQKGGYGGGRKFQGGGRDMEINDIKSEGVRKSV